MVVTELDDGVAFGVRVGDLGALIVHLSDGLEGEVAHERADFGEQLGGDDVVAVRGVIERGVEFLAASGGGGLDVPAGVVAAGAATQRHLGAGETQVRGVEVDGGELVVLLAGDGADLRQRGEIRQLGGAVDCEFGLDFEGTGNGHLLFPFPRRVGVLLGPILPFRGRKWPIMMRGCGYAVSARWRASSPAESPPKRADSAAAMPSCNPSRCVADSESVDR